MAGTRNKQMQNDFDTYNRSIQKRSTWNTEEILQSPAYPCSGINVQYIPSNQLATHAVDIETFLYGIGSNNYIFPTAPPNLDTKTMPTVVFTPTPNLYIPVLPPMLQHQRP